MPKTILITGASGFIGSHLVEYFVGQGWQVVAPVRRPEAQPARKHIRYVAYDLAAPPDDAMFAGADYLIHAAYARDDYRQGDALAINIAAAQRLVAAGKKHGLKKLLFISSMSARPDARSVYGKQKYAIERLFSGTRSAVLRPGLVLGGGGLVGQMARFMRSKHIVPLIGGGQQPLQIIAVADLVQAIQLVLQKDLSGTFTVAHPRVYSYRELYAALARHIGMRPVLVPVPYWLLRAALRVARLAHLPLHFTEDNLLGLQQARAADTTPDLAKLGLHTASLSEALSQTGSELR